ncbi:hypothetical protein [Flavobacterium sp. K5-23]|uniref:hypothetical protein n=1 Tax=Flavobacterium sp. K5-23 TaxID=2746225 RepID=UPI00201042EA|nr:hypothetical protein [Flavobacterium sp. K5-23]UQD56641.1 hypothetical protein FLAK523_09675 [Flavobacterium sp. K5-23]
MKDIFDAVYRKNYLDGCSSGLNPFTQLLDNNPTDEAYKSGFVYGRSKYENMNGAIQLGIPERIVTDDVLEEFLIAGMFGIDIDADGYTPYQFNIIEEWYKNGIEYYDPNESMYLSAIFQSNGIVAV